MKTGDIWWTCYQLVMTMSMAGQLLWEVDFIKPWMVLKYCFDYAVTSKKIGKQKCHISQPDILNLHRMFFWGKGFMFLCDLEERAVWKALCAAVPVLLELVLFVLVLLVLVLLVLMLLLLVILVLLDVLVWPWEGSLKIPLSCCASLSLLQRTWPVNCEGKGGGGKE